MRNSKWFFISLIGLSVTVIILSALPFFMKPDAAGPASIPKGLPLIGEMTGAALPQNINIAEVKRFMEEVNKNGGLTPELEQQAKERGIPEPMLQRLGSAPPPKGWNYATASAMIIAAIVIAVSSFRLYQLRKQKRDRKNVY
ncbi:hypothetical protein [Metabacillus sp. 84]|uniref:hypothetical protein n=1 Tax=unclassified Metabacillus TaxID=2675274 RepID=UPI003CE7A357